ncbi:MAG: universal stress protein [Gammaproteobacteria bacterium]
MHAYQHILIALDLTPDSDPVARRGQELAVHYGAAVSLLHVVEFVPMDPAGEALLPPPVDVENKLSEGARQRLDELCARLKLETRSRRIEIGNIKSEIARVTAEEHADLLVLGGRSRHGLALLMGSTEKSLVHKAPCDVLIVRLA